MATRNERVVLDLEDRFTRGMIEAAAATKLLDRELNSLSGSAVGSNRKLADSEKQITSTGRSAENTGKQIDRLSGRLALLAQAAAVLGPALIPIGAAGTPAVAGLATELGAAAGAVGVAMLAFHGLSDTMKAINKYALDPTAANFAKVQTQLEAMGPAGVHFVQFLEDVRPQLAQLQSAARAGMFPGMEDGITSLLTKLPRVKSIVTELATGMGDLSAEAGDALAGPKFQGFLQFVDREAKPMLEAFAHTVGNLALGFADMLVAFEPLTRSFATGFEDMSLSFANWAANLNTNQGFQEFLDYLRESGPQALDFLGSLTSALASIVAAAAPVGSAVLPVLTAMAKVLGTLADSPIGPMFFTAAAALSVYSRAMFVVEKAQTGFATSLKGTVGGLLSVTSAQDRARLSASQLTTAQRNQRTIMAGSLLQFGALGLVASGAADNMGLANTMTLGLMGTLAGPWGAAIGGATGLIMDFTKGADHAGHQLDDWNTLLRQNQSDLHAYVSTLGDAKRQLEEMSSVVPTSPLDSIMHSFDPEQIKLEFHALTGSLDDSALAKQGDEVEKLQSNYQDLLLSINELGRGMDMIEWGKSVTDVGRLNEIIAHAKPAMDALGISMEDLQHAAQDGSITGMVDQIVHWNNVADSTKGKSQAVAQAIAEIKSEATTTAQAASELAQSLDDLLSPQMNLSAATDAWTTALRHLNKDLAKHNKTLVGNTDAAIKNRAAIRDRVSDLTAVLTAEGAAGASSEDLARHLRRQRQALIDAGVAANMSRGELRDYLNQLGLTPKLVKTIVQANIDQAKAALAEARRELNAMDGKVATTYVRTIRTGPGGTSDPSGGTYRPAAGGLITGPGGPRDDVIPAWLSNGEFVVNAEATKRNIGLLAALNGRTHAQKFANGGVVGTAGPNVPTFMGWGPTVDSNGKTLNAALHYFETHLQDAGKGLERLGNHLVHELTARQTLLKDELDREKQRLDMLEQERDAIAQQVSSAFHTDVFGGSGTQYPDWFTPQDIAANNLATQHNELTSGIAEKKEALRLLKILRQHGLNGQAFINLAATGDVDTLRAYAEMSKSDLAQYERLYNRDARLEKRLGGYVGNAEMGHAIAAQAKDVHETRQELHQVNRQLVAVTKELQQIKKIEANQAKEHAKALDSVGAAAARRR